MIWLADEVLYAQQQYPLLTYFGFGEYGQPFTATPAKRSELLSPTALREIQICRTWLGYQTRTQRISRHFSSYGLKHIVEACTGMEGRPRAYVSNGAFIAAAIVDGWKVARCAPESPNAYFNLSRRLNRPSLAWLVAD